MSEYLKIIKDDLFGIANRLKEIDDKYFVVYNTKVNRYEVHNGRNVGDTLSVVCPYDELDARMLRLVKRTRVERATSLLAEMEANNKKLEDASKEKVMENAADRAKEILKKAKFCAV